MSSGGNNARVFDTSIQGLNPVHSTKPFKMGKRQRSRAVRRMLADRGRTQETQPDDEWGEYVYEEYDPLGVDGVLCHPAAPFSGVSMWLGSEFEADREDQEVQDEEALYDERPKCQSCGKRVFELAITRKFKRGVVQDVHCCKECIATPKKQVRKY